MADYLINFNPGEPLKASETNSNNQYLLDRISENTQSLQTYLETQIGILQSNISSVQKTLQSNIDNVNNSLSEQINTLANAQFIQKELNIGIGTSNLKSYLPDDGKQYLVWVNAYQDGGYAQLTATTDILTIPRVLYHTDNDAGRNSIAAALMPLPVGANRTITMSGNATWIKLCGYCQM